MIHTTMSAMVRSAVAVAAAISMTACGGGGSDKVTEERLDVTLSYSGETSVLANTTIRPTTTGFKSFTPRCSLVTGRLPVGMTMNSDCSLTGFPEESGNFPFTARVFADGVEGSVDFPSGISVRGPSLDYDFNFGATQTGTWTVGVERSSAPMNNAAWRPGPDVVTRYFVKEGELPPGLGIDPATGVVSGISSVPYNGSFRLGVTVTANGRSATLLQKQPTTAVSDLSITPYPLAVVATLGEWMSVSPKVTLPPGASVSYSYFNTTFYGMPLPEGLKFDPATGTISGYAERFQEKDQQFQIHMSMQSGAKSTLRELNVTLSVSSPTLVRYSPLEGQVGVPFVATAQIIGQSAGATYSYAADTSMPWPTGLVVDSASGRLSGTPTGPFAGRCYVLLTVRNAAGRSYLQREILDLVLR